MYHLGGTRWTPCDEVFVDSHSGRARSCFPFIYLLADVIWVIGLYLSALTVWENANRFFNAGSHISILLSVTSTEFPSPPTLFILMFKEKGILGGGCLPREFAGTEPCLTSSSAKANLRSVWKRCASPIVKKTRERVTFIIVVRAAVIKCSQYLKMVLVPLLGFILALIIV